MSIEALIITCRCTRKMVESIARPGVWRCGCGCVVTVQRESTSSDLCALRDTAGRPCRLPRHDEALELCLGHGRRIAAQVLGVPDEAEKLGRAKGMDEYQNERRAVLEEQERKLQEARARRLAMRDPPAHVVYYVRLQPGVIKIGTSEQLARRMYGLRIRRDEDVLAAEPGSYKEEALRHFQFKHLRRDLREDFTESDELLAHIAALRKEHGRPYELVARLISDWRQQTQDLDTP